jgi:hypothetical protein
LGRYGLFLFAFTLYLFVSPPAYVTAEGPYLSLATIGETINTFGGLARLAIDLTFHLLAMTFWTDEMLHWAHDR